MPMDQRIEILSTNPRMRRMIPSEIIRLPYVVDVGGFTSAPGAKSVA